MTEETLTKMIQEWLNKAPTYYITIPTKDDHKTTELVGADHLYHKAPDLAKKILSEFKK
jgi:hypothetical protein